ncbi:site-specific integrase [Gordonia sp. ABSL49_1]|uniref:tyrosine-type recombinase/integrase n=1 Tax=Gordonia sp. ABSL49_1 TaxID=2920941 RepID=UPI001F0DC38E|nr:site-specific integrase [Gordonia sp. ABSL49_1]MCH5644362.1 site-specific integrase [Gordonia sp. ABSL49_1]
MAGKKGHRGWGYIRKLPSGRLQASYVGPDLVRHTAPTTYTHRIDAEGWLSNERRKIEMDVWEPPALARERAKARIITLAEYADRWVDERQLKPRTRSGYKDLLRLHIKPTLGNVAMKNILAGTIRSWHSGLGTEYPRRNSHAYGLLHAIMATAAADGVIAANPCTIPRAMNPPRKRDPMIPTVAEVAELADVIRPERFRALILLAAWCGVRWGEVTELRRSDLTEGCEVLQVSRAVTRRDGQYRVDSTKSGRGRAVVVPPHIRDDIQHHLDTHVGEEPDALLFPSARGKHLNDRTFRREYYAHALESIGKPDMHIHDLRHFAGTQAARVGNLVETMGRLGHSTVRASLIYQQIVTGRDAEVAKALSALATEGVPGDE